MYSQKNNETNFIFDNCDTVELAKTFGTNGKTT